MVKFGTTSNFYMIPKEVKKWIDLGIVNIDFDNDKRIRIVNILTGQLYTTVKEI